MEIDRDEMAGEGTARVDGDVSGNWKFWGVITAKHDKVVFAKCACRYARTSIVSEIAQLLVFRDPK